MIAAIRIAVILLLVTAAVLFLMYVTTGEPRYKRWGLAILKWTVIAALGFFAVLFVDRVLE
jgi:energy-converting hydrogenase Eha subunit A